MLVLFDNADDLEVISKYLPDPSTSCHILITTRTTESHQQFCQDNTNVMVLETLDEATAVSALIGLAGREETALSRIEREAAEKIAVLPPVELLPIALCHAGSYLLRHGNVTFESYWEKLVAEEKKLATAAIDLDTFFRYFRLSHLGEVLRRAGIRKPADLRRAKVKDFGLNVFDEQSMKNAVKKLNTTRHAFLTWEMDISDIEENFPSAYSVLACCCVMSSRSVPQGVISEFLTLSHGSSDRLLVEEALDDLKKYTLLNRVDLNGGRETYSMHYLIHQSMFERLRQRKARFEAVLLMAGDSIYSFLFGKERTLTEFSFRSSAPHYYLVSKNMMKHGILPWKTDHVIMAVNMCYECEHFGAAKDLSLIAVDVANHSLSIEEQIRTKAALPCTLTSISLRFSFLIFEFQII